MLEALRTAVITEAESWVGTPFHHHAAVKGAGVDCLNLLAEVYRAAGVIEHVAIPHYPPDIMLHRGEETFLEGLLRHGRAIAGPPGPGDVALFRFGRIFAHGAIVVLWPRLIHANFLAKSVTWGDAGLPPLAGRPVRFFTVLGGGGT